ncbi:MAG TPA: universal stress protein [Balneolaceae bacterium]|nr:universal stress protein [Balneolaceae bacterium]
MAAFINEILFPTDFSDNAQHALPFVLDLARRSKAKVRLFHSIEEVYELAPLQSDFKTKANRKVKLLLQDLREGIVHKEEYTGIDIQLDSMSGLPVFSIMEEVNSNPSISLIVMGTKGATGLKKVLFGSVTSDVILRSNIPVLAIPQHIPFQQPSNIIYATDYRKGDMRSLDQLTQWAKLYNATLKVVHVAPDLNLEEDIKFRGFRDLCEERISYKKIGYDLIIEDNFHAGIAIYLEQNPQSILSMTRYSKNVFSSIFKQSHSKDLSCYTKAPLLVLIGEEARQGI